MLKVDWNDIHSYKILKYYKNGVLQAFKYDKEWYTAVYDPSGIEYDSFGNSYIANDCCDNCIFSQLNICANRKYKCEPIYKVCKEFKMLTRHIEKCSDPHKWKKGDEYFRF